jgi:glutathione S-transferase
MRAEAATLLDETLRGCDWLVDDSLSCADFRMACVLTFADIAGLPLNDHPTLSASYARRCDISAWSEPFANLLAPELPPVPG